MLNIKYYKLVLFFLLASPLPAQVFDVKQYGHAVCDGVTDDTAAIQKTINAAATSPDVSKVYFPFGGMCKATVLRWPGQSQRGWFITEFDTGLVADHLYLGSYNAYIGHSSSFSGFNPLFATGPYANWIQGDTAKGPFVEISGTSSIWIEGIAINGTAASGLYIHDNAKVGSVSIRLKRSAVTTYRGPAIEINSSTPTTIAGFMLQTEDCTISSSDPASYAMDVTNFGMITIRGGYLGSFHYRNKGIASSGDVTIDDVLSESLSHDFFFSEASPGIVSDITLRRVKLADTIGKVFMLKTVTTNNQLTNVKIEMTPNGNLGAGLVDPTSTPRHLGLICEGYGCGPGVRGPNNPLYFGKFTGPGGPTVFYGSVHQPQPMQVITAP